MKRFFTATVLLFVFVTTYSFADKEILSKYGEVTSEDLEMKSLPLDTTADAAYLFDDGESLFDFQTSLIEPVLVFHRTFRIKVFTKNGCNQAQIAIPLLYKKSDTEEFRKLRAVTYTLENGNVVKTPLNPQKVICECYGDQTKVARFSMPNVQVGSILEVEYEIVSPFFNHYPNWYFQHRIPVIYSRYQAHMVPFYTYNVVLQGASSIENSDSYTPDYEMIYRGKIFREKIFRWTLEQSDALKTEPFMPESESLLLKINFQLLSENRPDGRKTHYSTTWPVLCEQLLKDKEFGGFLKKSVRNARKDLPDFLPDQTRYARAEAIYNKVISEFKWNALFRKYAMIPYRKFLKSKTGSSAEINLYLIGMLKAAGIEAYPVILCTRENGKIRVDSPFDFYFNDVIAAARIDNKIILLDATSPMSGFGKLPFNCINDRALMIKSEKSFEWLTLSVPSVSYKDYMLDIRKSPTTDSLDITVEHMADGYYSKSERESLKHHSNDSRWFIPKDFHLTSPLKIVNEDNPNNTLKIAFSGKKACEMSGTKMVISPFCSLTCDEAAFTCEKRRYPVDLIFKRGIRCVSTVHIPSGYDITSIPENVSVNKDAVLLKAGFERKEDVVVCTLHCEYQKENFDVGHYPALYDASTALNRILGTQLTFVRK